MRMINRFVLLFLSFISIQVFAGQQSLAHYTQSADHVTGFILSLIHAFATLLGMGFLFGALVQYQRHRQSKQEVPLGRVLMLFFVGLLMLGITMVPRYVDQSGNTTIDPKSGAILKEQRGLQDSSSIIITPSLPQ